MFFFSPASFEGWIPNGPCCMLVGPMFLGFQDLGTFGAMVSVDPARPSGWFLKGTRRLLGTERTLGLSQKSASQDGASGSPEARELVGRRQAKKTSRPRGPIEREFMWAHQTANPEQGGVKRSSRGLVMICHDPMFVWRIDR